MRSQDPTPRLSVVIPTRNRAPLLAQCLDSLRSQSVPAGVFEVIVVDNDSTDDTRAVCEQSGKAFRHFRYVFEPRPGLHCGRHAGMRNAQGDILVFADDDIEAFPTWLEGVLDAFDSPNIVLVGGPCIPKFETPPPAWFDSLKTTSSNGWWIGSYSLLDFGTDIQEISPSLVFGCNFSIRRDVLEEIGGFHPDGMPRELIRFRGDGESAVSRAIEAKGLKALYHPKAAVLHLVSENRLTSEYLHWRAYIQGISDSYTRVRGSGGVSIQVRIRDWLRKRRALFRDDIKHVLHRSSQIHRVQGRGYWEGHQYHQREVARDPELLKWVLKTNYLEDHGRFDCIEH